MKRMGKGDHVQTCPNKNMKYQEKHYKCKCGDKFTVYSDHDFTVYCPRCGKKVKEQSDGEHELESIEEIKQTQLEMGDNEDA